MRKYRALLLLIIVAITMTSCGKNAAVTKESIRYSAEFAEYFDTYILFVAYAKSEEEFRQYVEIVQAQLGEMAQLCDIYNEYQGINNIYTINSAAGKNAVKVDKRVIDLLLFSKKAYTDSLGTVNVAMGAVLSLWHDYREAGIFTPPSAELPDINELKEREKLCNIEDMIIDKDKSEVYLAHEGVSLDVGAVAKGFTAGLIAESLKAEGLGSFIINIGGDVLACGAPEDAERDLWGVGINSPIEEGEGLYDAVFVNDAYVVTSGSYERFYVVGGKEYCHIINPETLMPADRFSSVTVISDTYGYGEILSTALFILSVEEGKALAEQYKAEAIWIYNDGSAVYTDGYCNISKNFSGEAK